MNGQRQLAIREIQLAYALGYTDVEPFRRAVRNGRVPAPNEYDGKKPVWYMRDIEARYGSDFLNAPAGSEQDVLAAIERG